MRRLSWAAGALVLGLAAVPLLPAVGHAEATNPLAGVVTAEAEAFAARVEYDIPLPVSPGTFGHVVGEIRRSQAGENAKGLAAAPTHFDAVVGGTYADPNKNAKGDERNVPQTECFFPGHLLDTHFAFPTDTQAETAGLPATSYATARCGAGPEVELHSSTVDATAPAVFHVGSVASDALARPVTGAVNATSATRAAGLSILDGAITVAGVELSGASRITGTAGEQTTSSRITLHDVSAGGVTFSIADDQLIIAGQSLPVGSPAAQAVFDSVNAGLAATGCRVTAATSPNRYPQGFLFGRPEPKVGTDPAGTFAASYRAGLFVFCDLPASVTDNAKVGNDVFSPQRAQIVVGFVYTSATASTEPGGFGLGNLLDDAPAIPAVAAGGPPAPTTDLGLPDLSADGLTAPAAAASAAARGAAVPRAKPAAFIHFGSMKGTTRWALAVVSFLVWAALTHVGARRLRGVLGK
jgi:hypothetical protein